MIVRLSESYKIYSNRNPQNSLICNDLVQILNNKLYLKDCCATKIIIDYRILLLLRGESFAVFTDHFLTT